MNVTPEFLLTLAGFLLAAAARYIPRFNVWFEKLLDEQKQLIMLGLLVLGAAGSYLGTCQGLWAVGVCGDWTSYVQALILAIGTNQGGHLVLPKPPATRNL